VRRWSVARPRNTERVDAILKAAIRIVGERGPDAVTHRAVAEEAGVPLAATTYYFSSKRELLDEALRYAADRDVEDMRRLAADFPVDAPSADVFAEIIARYLAYQARARRTMVVAQYELALEAARRPSLRTTARRQAEAFLVLVEPMLRAIGSREPRRDARLLMAAMDGLLLDEMFGRGTVRADALLPVVQRLLNALTLPVQRRQRTRIAGSKSPVGSEPNTSDSRRTIQ
jgi:DNA-binding transcriptional regulator YbjK